MRRNMKRACAALASALVGIAILVGGAGTALSAVTSSSFTLSGAVGNPRTYTFADLSALPATTETVTYFAAGSPVTATFTGVSLWALLTMNGQSLITNPGVKNDILREYVVATGTDGYTAVISLGEIHPNFGGQLDLVAYLQDGQPIAADGFARIVVPGDKFGGRYVSNLASLQVVNAAPVPEPQAVALMLAGLTVLGWRLRKGVS
jgi:DMSO/TMAO reductase YedYZ molybdopterin-dependent catalytic subunit